MQVSYPFSNFYSILENNAKIAPHKSIIYEYDLKISNLEFRRLVDALAEFLYNREIKPLDKIAIVMSNSWQFVVTLFAISKVGAIAVPVNNFLKEDELAYILNDAQAKMLFSSFKFAHETQNLYKKTDVELTVWVDGCPLENDKNLDYAKLLNIGKPPRPPVVTNINDTALIVYTSGTTGRPKGAMLSFKNIFSNCEGCKALMKLKDGQLQLLCYLPMFHVFTLTVTVMLPIYTNSAIIIIHSLSGIKDFKYLLKQLLFKRCHYFTGIPDIYSAMAKARLPWYFHWFHNVKGFISGAAPLALEIHKQFAQKFKRGMLLEGYGISECSPIVSCNTPTSNRVGSVGQPIGGYLVKIFDEFMQEVPLGNIGEICVKGDCVMQGYFNRPADTAKAIIDGWFKTGDIGKVDNDGYIYIVDRLKDLIIHKGMNIYPREIEEVLYAHNKIQACAVIGEKDKENNEIPIAYIELKENEIASECEIKEFAKAQLATFKLPRRIIFIKKLPRNATGKILKRELRELHKQAHI